MGVPVSNDVIPELPILRSLIWPDKLGRQSVKLDYAVFAADRSKVFLVELKTDPASRSHAQDQYLARSVEVGFRSIVEGIVEIAQATNANQKYGRLLHALADHGCVQLPDGLDAHIWPKGRRGLGKLLSSPMPHRQPQTGVCITSGQVMSCAAMTWGARACVGPPNLPRTFLHKMHVWGRGCRTLQWRHDQSPYTGTDMLHLVLSTVFLSTGNAEAVDTKVVVEEEAMVDFAFEAGTALRELQPTVAGVFVDDEGISTPYTSTCTFLNGKLRCPDFGWVAVVAGAEDENGFDVYSTNLNNFQGLNGSVVGGVELFDVDAVGSGWLGCNLSFDDGAECEAYCQGEERGSGVAHSGSSVRNSSNPSGSWWACNQLNCICDTPGYGFPPGSPEGIPDRDPRNGDGDEWCVPPPNWGQICR